MLAPTPILNPVPNPVGGKVWKCKRMTEARRRILVIEDDRETADQLVESLATSGYQVDLAIDGDTGLSRGRSAEYASSLAREIAASMSAMIWVGSERFW